MISPNVVTVAAECDVRTVRRHSWLVDRGRSCFLDGTEQRFLLGPLLHRRSPVGWVQNKAKGAGLVPRAIHLVVLFGSANECAVNDLA